MTAITYTLDAQVNIAPVERFASALEAVGVASGRMATTVVANLDRALGTINAGSGSARSTGGAAQTASAGAGIERLGLQADNLQRQLKALEAVHPEIRFTANGEAVVQQVTNLQTRLAALADK